MPTQAPTEPKTVVSPVEKPVVEPPKPVEGSTDANAPGGQSFVPTERVAPAPSPEQRPDFIEEKDWKGSLKDTIQSLKSAAHFKGKEAEKPEPVKEAEVVELGGDALNPINAELVERGDGSLSDETRKSLRAKYKISDSVIDAHLRGLKAVLRANTLAAIDEAGGKEAYAEFMARFEQLSDAEKEKFGLPFQSDDEEAVRDATRTAMDFVEVRFGGGGSLSQGARGEVTGPLFKTRADVLMAMADWRYPKSDSGITPIQREYQQEVQRILEASQRAGYPV